MVVVSMILIGPAAISELDTRYASIESITYVDIFSLGSCGNIQRVDENIISRTDQRWTRYVDLTNDIHHDDSIDWVRGFRRDIDDQRVFLPVNRERLPSAIGEQIDTFRLIRDTRDNQLAIGRPVEDVQIQPFAAVDGLLSTPTPLEILEGACHRPVDRLAVDIHPVAELTKAIDGWSRKDSFGSGADIQEEVASFGGDVS